MTAPIYPLRLLPQQERFPSHTAKRNQSHCFLQNNTITTITDLGHTVHHNSNIDESVYDMRVYYLSKTFSPKHCTF